MKITCETLTELSSTIKEIIDGYHGSGSGLQRDENIHTWHFFAFSSKHEKDEKLRKYASDAYGCALNIWQQNPQLPEPPKPVSDPLTDLQQIRLWCIRAKAPTQSKEDEQALPDPVSKKARLIYKKLNKLEPYEAMTLPEIQDWIYDKHEINLDEGTWKNIRQELDLYGLKNKPRIGYFIRK